MYVLRTEAQNSGLEVYLRQSCAHHRKSRVCTCPHTSRVLRTRVLCAVYSIGVTIHFSSKNVHIFA